MLKSNRITLLIIPAEGGKTFEFKVPRLLLWFFGLCSVALLGLLLQGFRSYFDVRDLDWMVVRLERDKALATTASLPSLRHANSRPFSPRLQTIQSVCH